VIVIMEPGASGEQIAAAEQHLVRLGFRVYRSQGEYHTVLGAIGDGHRDIDTRALELLAGVREARRVSRPYKLVDRSCNPAGTVVDVRGRRVGGDELVVMAGPCAVEGREQMRRAAADVAKAGGHILRGGAFKPRSSPYAFQGLGEEGLRYLREAADEHDMPCVTEVLDPSHVDLICQYVDLLQVGARNMQNFALLAALGAVRTPVLLKRGLAATIEELLLAAEYIVASGNPRVILCERGIRTFSAATRNTLDLSAIPVLRKMTHLPVIVDPSHATGVREYVTPMARAAVAAGADGIIVEVHPDPDHALSDGPQSLDAAGFVDLMGDLRIIAPAVRKRVMAQKRTPARKIASPLFPRAAIVGVGLIGGSMALAMRESGALGSVVGVDESACLDNIRAAGVVDELCGAGELERVVAEADLVILAAPVKAIVGYLDKIAPSAKPGCLVVDVGSTKQVICEAARRLPSHLHFIGGHPMAGTEKRGAAFADPLMFYDAVWVLCPVGSVPEELLSRWQQVLASIGALPLAIEPGRHDRLVAAVSHVPRLVAAAMSNAVGRLATEDPMAPELAAGGFRDITRVASSPFEMWRDVLATNQQAIRERLRAFQEALACLDAKLEVEAGLEAELTEAARHRLAVPHRLQGMFSPECELMVRVVDEPGALAAIVTPLALEQVNVRDIQILKQRQDEDGVLRLAFGDSRDTRRAAEILRRAGKDVRIRGGSSSA
jgi:3-deoxy-7-phosphoheptulonate synthase